MKESSENAKNQPHILVRRTPSASPTLHCGNVHCKITSPEAILRLSPVVSIFVRNSLQ